MRFEKVAFWLLVSQLLIVQALVATELSGSDGRGGSPALEIVTAEEPAALREALREVLERNLRVARAEREAAVMAARIPQVRALPDPKVGLTLFALPPETRLGPQRATASFEQRLPWRGKLGLAERIAGTHAEAAEAEVEVARLEAVTEARRLYFELAFESAREALVRSERGALDRYEQAAQARYTSGAGLQQEILRIQTQITRADTRLLEIAERRAMLLAAFNALRDRPAHTPLPIEALPEPATVEADRAVLLDWAHETRPELWAIDAHHRAHDLNIELAGLAPRPDVTVGLSYTLVDRRDDALARAMPPAGNGDDILALTGTVALPIRKGKLEAAVHEAQARAYAADEEHRRFEREIENEIGDLSARLPLLREHLDLLTGVLVVQAREALRSAETAYSTGKLNAVDLLDAEVVLLEVQVAAERTRADLRIARAQLEHAVARPLDGVALELNDRVNEESGS